MTIKDFAYKIAYQSLQLLNAPIKKSRWYNSLFVANDGEIYPNNKWYREHDERNFDIVVLGSSSAKWAFSFDNIPIKGMNWAQAPQTLVEDFNILRNFHSILRQGGYVIITVMPFSCLNKQTNIYDALKYLKISTHQPIEPHMIDQARRYFNYPIFIGKPAIKAGIRYILKQESTIDLIGETTTSNPMSPQQLEHNAHCFIKGWKQQFGINDLEAPLTSQNMEGRLFRIELMQAIIDFCIERDYQPVYLIPPVSNYLSKYFTPHFKDLYIYSFLKDVGRDIPLLDYSKTSELKEEKYYFNSFFLNRNGREHFTKIVLNDLHII